MPGNGWTQRPVPRRRVTTGNPAVRTRGAAAQGRHRERRRDAALRERSTPSSPPPRSKNSGRWIFNHGGSAPLTIHFEHEEHGAGEYVRGGAHTNTIEGFFDFRYNQRVALGINDPARTEAALRGIVGKRLMTYRDSSWTVG